MVRRRVVHWWRHFRRPCLLGAASSELVCHALSPESSVSRNMGANIGAIYPAAPPIEGGGLIMQPPRIPVIRAMLCPRRRGQRGHIHEMHLQGESPAMSGTAMCSHPRERSRRSFGQRLILFCATLSASAAAMAQAPNFIAFESGHVRPMAMSADRTRLFVTNTPDNT